MSVSVRNLYLTFILMKIGYFYSNFSWRLILLRAQHLYLLQRGYNEPLKFLMGLCSEKPNIRIGMWN